MGRWVCGVAWCVGLGKELFYYGADGFAVGFAGELLVGCGDYFVYVFL